jgi:Family of unknown function (DUF6058)
MQTLRDYLARYYIDLDELALLTGIAVVEVEHLVASKLAPAPSYVVTPDRKLISCVFGEFEAQDAPQGRYFHKDGHVWLTQAAEAHRRLGVVAAREELRARFKSNFTQALQGINDSLVRLPDTFSGSGELKLERLNKRFEETWDALIDGVYNLCVADPSNERSIARKEMLQEYLQEISSKVQTGDSLDASERHRVLSLIQQYADAAMPFAPPEYPRSSRKRLVEDFATALRREARARARTGG